jgi:hypothetical protein
MSERNQKRILIAAVLLLLALTYWGWRTWEGRTQTVVLPPAPVAPIPRPAPIPVPLKKETPTVLPKPVTPMPPVTPVPPLPQPVPTPVPPPSIPPVTAPIKPTPPPIVLHKELIPKNIEIVRCYYDREIVGPDTTFGFDINGSGFTDEFQNMIRVDAGGLDIEVKNLRLVTANQIHGDMVVGSAQTTDFIYPRVLIHDLPVFRAPDPFAVVRPGEVLIIIFVSLAEDGRSGRFRVITNLSDTMAKEFKLVASHPGLEISNMEFHLPFAVEGILSIGPGVPQGEYGMTAFIGQRQVWKGDHMIRIVRPNVGLTGFVQGISAEDMYHRPGDTVQLYLHGSGLTPVYTSVLSGKVNEFDMGPSSFTFISASQMRFSFNVPPNAPLRSYGVSVYGQKNQQLYTKNDVFTLVPPNWIAGVQIAPPIRSGQQGQLRIVGRDLSPAFVQGIELSTDEPGIQLKNLRRLDNSVAVTDISVSTSVAPGDYWIHLTSEGKAIQPPYGSIIKVEAP